MDVNIYTRTSSQATEKEKDTFVKLVKSRGAVNEEYVRNGVEREGTVMVFLKLGEEVVGVAALKVPSDEYRSGLGLKTKSGHPVLKEKFPYELGYVAVSEKHEGKGWGRLLAQVVVRLAEGDDLFATTSNPTMLLYVLPHLGFKWVGNTWESKQTDGTSISSDLHLMIRVNTT
jgi:GNAT superfamily N-acetyltransferase